MLSATKKGTCLVGVVNIISVKKRYPVHDGMMAGLAAARVIVVKLLAAENTKASVY